MRTAPPASGGARALGREQAARGQKAPKCPNSAPWSPTSPPRCAAPRAPRRASRGVVRAGVGMLHTRPAWRGARREAQRTRESQKRANASSSAISAPEGVCTPASALLRWLHGAQALRPGSRRLTLAVAPSVRQRRSAAHEDVPPPKKKTHTVATSRAPPRPRGRPFEALGSAAGVAPHLGKPPAKEIAGHGVRAAHRRASYGACIYTPSLTDEPPFDVVAA